MPAFPYMRLFVGDYLGDTRHLTTLEHGAYLLLICTYWQRSEPLPADDKKLAHITGLSRHQWVKIGPTIKAFFDEKNGKIFHHRIEQEIEHMLTKSLKAKGAGRASAQRRFNKRPTKPVPVPEEEVTDKSVNAGAEAPASVSDLPDDQPPDGGDAIAEQYTTAFEKWWSIYPNKTGKRKAFQEYQLAFKRLGGQKQGTERVHAKLHFALEAQVLVWKKRRIEGRFIPHAATWLHQSRYDDQAVLDEQGRKRLPPREPAVVELAPTEPKPEKRGPRFAPVGWKPNDDQEES